MLHEAEAAEIPLSGFREEFRVALTEEIEASRRTAATGAVPLINGKLIGQVGEQFQYVFTIETFLNVPGDAPGDLYVPNRRRLEVAVVSVDGMTVTLSLPENLGKAVPTARLQSNLTQLMRKLISRIEDLGSRPNDVGDRVLGLSAVQGNPGSVEIEGLDEHQRAAVASGLGRNMSFVWGPPGTGKTATIGRLVAELLKAQRSVLLVSHTNTAVDQAVLQLDQHVDQSDVAAGRIIRIGEPRDRRLLEHPDLLLHTHVQRRSAALAERLKQLDARRTGHAAEIGEFHARLELYEWAEVAAGDIMQAREELQRLYADEEDVAGLEVDKERLDAIREDWVTSSELAGQMLQKQKRIEDILEALADQEPLIEFRRQQVDEVEEALEEAQVLLEESESSGRLARRWRRLPDPEEQRRLVDDLQADSFTKTQDLSALEAGFRTLEQERDDLGQALSAHKQETELEPAEILEKHRHYEDRVLKLREQIAESHHLTSDRRSQLHEQLREWVLTLADWDLTSETDGSSEELLVFLSKARAVALGRLKGFDAEKARRRVKSLNIKIKRLDGEIESITERLKIVEELVISEASVVATTLTRAYLRDSVQKRRFDTVILDEASMAPIPALWIAASVARENAVVVGDPKQLPPIVLSSHELAEKWLGRDIFEVSGVSKQMDAPPDHLVVLRRQYRMHPWISGIANELVYGGELIDAPTTAEDGSLYEWFEASERFNKPVLLVDTEPLHAWVTSVHRGARSSRLNFLSAVVSVDLATQLLSETRPPLSPGDSPRVLIVCPYRPHARLLELLIGEEGIDLDVVAGTAHTFQGSEADVVVLDLVNDEPHWRVGLFNPAFDETTRRILNVAVTRARRRLIVVGDFAWMTKNSKQAFLGRKFIKYLRDNFPLVDAREVMVSDLFKKAADISTTVYGGVVTPKSDRIVVTEDQFFPMLRADIANAKKRIVVYSPFITEARVGSIAPQLRAAVDRGVQVYVVTKAQGDRGKRELPHYRRIERTLTDWGLVVIHKGRMHEKVVFVDDDIIWSGSLNPLSFSDTQEVMERRASLAVSTDYAGTLRLGELIEEYSGGSSECPICGSEIIAQEGRDDPYYWRCVEPDCYTRGINQPRIEGGVITCSNCGESVEFGSWGNSPAWRCTENRRHRQRVARTHLRLPKMQALIPKRELAELKRQFGISG